MNTQGSFYCDLLSKVTGFQISTRASLVDSLLPDESGAVSIMHAHLLTPGFNFKFTGWKDHPCPTGLSVHSALSRFSVNVPSVRVYFYPRKGYIPGRVVPQERFTPGGVFIPGRVVPQAGFTPGRVVPRTVAWVRPRAASGLAPARICGVFCSDSFSTCSVCQPYFHMVSFFFIKKLYVGV